MSDNFRFALDADAITRVVPFVLPLKLRFRQVTSRAGVLVEGPEGWGEFSPFPDYGPGYAARWYAAAVDAATRPLPAPLRDSVPVNTTVPAVDPDVAYGLVLQSQCRTAKVKVGEPGQDLSQDVARVRAVRAAFDAAGVADARIRVDANGAWDVETAVMAIARLVRAARGLEYVEQPCASIPELAQVRRRSAVPIAADESIRTSEDPVKVRDAEAADIIVIKAQPLYGVNAALEIIASVGLPAVISSAVESSVGLALGVALAAAVPELRYDCGLGTASLLARDVTTTPLLPVDGHLPVGRVVPDGALEEVTPHEPEATQLLERFYAAQRAYSG
ncbi:MAG: o-succinylbenzoate synthase [Nitriliruptoraceae bacterium]